MNAQRQPLQPGEALCQASEGGGHSSPQAVVRFLLFSLVGGAATAAHYAVLLSCVRLLALNPVAASVLGAACGALASYMLNYHVTFCATAAHRLVLRRFLVMAGTGQTLNLLLMHALVDIQEMHYMVAQVLTTLMVLAANYLLSAQWVFTERGKQ